jgi:hypothetical protein
MIPVKAPDRLVGFQIRKLSTALPGFLFSVCLQMSLLEYAASIGNSGRFCNGFPCQMGHSGSEFTDSMVIMAKQNII